MESIDFMIGLDDAVLLHDLGILHIFFLNLP